MVCLNLKLNGCLLEGNRLRWWVEVVFGYRSRSTKLRIKPLISGSKEVQIAHFEQHFKRFRYGSMCEEKAVNKIKNDTLGKRPFAKPNRARTESMGKGRKKNALRVKV